MTNRNTEAPQGEGGNNAVAAAAPPPSPSRQGSNDHLISRGLQKWSSFPVIKRNWMDIMEEEMVYFNAYIIGLLQK